jgi:hypothetical protein
MLTRSPWHQSGGAVLASQRRIVLRDTPVARRIALIPSPSGARRATSAKRASRSACRARWCAASLVSGRGAGGGTTAAASARTAWAA